MKDFDADLQNSPTIAELYPDLPPEQQQDAEYFLARYLDLIERIYVRINSDKTEEKANLTD